MKRYLAYAVLLSMPCIMTVASGSGSVVRKLTLDAGKVFQNKQASDFLEFKWQSLASGELTLEKLSVTKNPDEIVDLTLAIPGEIDGKRVAIAPKAFKAITSATLRLSLIFNEKDGNKISFPKNCSGMFRDSLSIMSVDFGDVDASRVENMCSMFRGCSNIFAIDLRSLNTERVSCGNMRRLFCGCDNLKWLNISSFTGEQKELDVLFDMFNNANDEDVWAGGDPLQWLTFDLSNIKIITDPSLAEEMPQVPEGRPLLFLGEEKSEEIKVPDVVNPRRPVVLELYKKPIMPSGAITKDLLKAPMKLPAPGKQACMITKSKVRVVRSLPSSGMDRAIEVGICRDVFSLIKKPTVRCVTMRRQGTSFCSQVPAMQPVAKSEIKEEVLLNERRSSVQNAYHLKTVGQAQSEDKELDNKITLEQEGDLTIQETQKSSEVSHKGNEQVTVDEKYEKPFNRLETPISSSAFKKDSEISTAPTQIVITKDKKEEVNAPTIEENTVKPKKHWYTYIVRFCGWVRYTVLSWL